VRFPSASLLLPRLSEFLVIRRIYSASYPLQAPGKRAYGTTADQQLLMSNSVAKSTSRTAASYARCAECARATNTVAAGIQS
jgi:hypothetical protein